MTIFYDLIPFLYHQNYLPDPHGLASRDYAQRFHEIYKTDMFVTDSQTAADDLAVYLGVDPTRTMSIFGAGASRKTKPNAPMFAAQLDDGFVFMPTGDDFRKNNARAVAAFAALHNSMPLVLTSNFSDESKRQLQAIYSDLLFAGTVTDAEFLWLMDKARAVFFPTEYEGLGLPILEAVERGATVACSNIPVFTEISREAFFQFDPRSPADITATLRSVLSMRKDNPIVISKKKQYAQILDRFTWEATAKLFVEAMRKAEGVSSRQRLAIFCPSPASYSAVGKVVLEAHAELSRYYDIDYYAEDGFTPFEPTRPNILQFAANYYPATEYEKRKGQYDAVLYNIGNSEFHVETILTALRSPANAIIHDTQLNGIFDYMTSNGFLTPERRNLETRLDEVVGSRKSSCLVSVATNQKAAFCYSTYAEEALKEILVPRIFQPMQAIGVPENMMLRSGRPVVSLAGIISEDKGIGLVKSISSIEDIMVKVFGFGVLGDSPLLENVGPNVEVLRDLTDKDFQDALRATDILVNYRMRYKGETSRGTLEAMRYGAVVIVRDVGWYAELPDDAVVKVTDTADVLQAVQELIGHPKRRQEIGRNAQEFLRKEYGYGKYAAFLSRVMREEKSD
jgi:glycosyltransferase involved in cell wall biosynthesis